MRKKSKAFTLLEVMISVLILTISAGAIYTISSQTKKIVTKSEYSITAMYLAQEGLEFIRNIRNEKLSQSLNKENGWNKFLTDDLGFGGIGSGGYLVKKIKNEKGKFSLENAGVDFEKQISSIDDICFDVGKYENCIYEYINLKENGNQETDNLGNIFFRKIKIEKEFGETNLIKVYSEIFWEEYGEIQNFVLEQKLGNIAIN